VGRTQFIRERNSEFGKYLYHSDEEFSAVAEKFDRAFEANGFK